MLKLYPDQVARQWDRVKYTIENALPPLNNESIAEDRMNKVLESILVGRLEVWIFREEEQEGTSIIYGFVTTAITYAVDGTGNELFIYSVFASHKLSRNILFQAIELLKKYARSKECSSITALTNLESFKKMISTIGGDSSYTYLRLEV